jgi:hypothetical protein
VPRQLLYRVKRRLQETRPSLKQFMTLSPIPLFSRWLFDQISKGTVDVSSLSKVVDSASVVDRLKRLTATDLETV